ncbi:MAG: hypothetical protein ABIY52_01575 [Gemmatimonadaceae bacterium]
MRKLIAISLLMLAGVRARAQAPVPSALAGEWRLAFSSAGSSEDPEAKPVPWITFVATVVQVGSALGGAMRTATGDGPTGQFGCKLREGACSAGRMRLSWDGQDWQVFEFRLDPSGTKGEGRAEIRFTDGGTDKYTFVISRPAR